LLLALGQKRMNETKKNFSLLREWKKKSLTSQRMKMEKKKWGT